MKEHAGKLASSISEAVRKGRSLTRTRSESDLIRALAKSKQSKSAVKKPNTDSDDESQDSLLEDNGRQAVSLRSFTKEDEERFDRYCLESSDTPYEHCEKIGEEDERSQTGEHTASGDADLSPQVSETTSTVKSSSNIAPVTAAEESESQSHAANTSASPVKDEETRASEVSGSTSGSSDLADSDVDLEYLQHENDLLKDSLESVSQERDFLAQDNWDLRMELENLKNQMRFLMSTTGSPSMYVTTTGPPPTMYATGSPPIYISEPNQTYMSIRVADQNIAHPYACYNQPPTPQTFEESLKE